MERANETMSYRLLIGIQIYYTPILVSLGTLGNCLSILVFFTTKLRKLSSSYYLSALAVTDTGYLLFTFSSWLNFFDVQLFNKPGFCEFSVYMTQVCSFLSVWFIVAFTVERFIAVRYPLKRPSMCTVSRAKAVVLGLSVVALLGYTPYIFVTHVTKEMQTNSTEVNVCGARREMLDLVTTLNHMDAVITLFIPFFAIVILNTLISRTVCRVARVRRSMTKSTGASGIGTGVLGGGGGGGRGIGGGGGSSSRSARTSSSQTKVTEMLLVVSTVFIVLNLPMYMLRIWLYVSDSFQPAMKQSVELVILQHYFYVLFQTNYGINFALYCVSGQNFRKALASIFWPDLVQRRAADVTQVTAVSEYCRTASTRRTLTVNGSWKEAHELVPINKAV